jgi:hypothetical protein
MMGIVVPEACWGNKTAYFVASSWFFIFHCVAGLIDLFAVSVLNTLRPAAI